MNPPLFSNRTRISARALYVGQRLDLRAFDHTHSLASAPLLVTAGSDGCVALFRYGVVVLLGLTGAEEAAFLQSLSPIVTEPPSDIESEQVDIVIDTTKPEGTALPGICLHGFEVERLQLVADALAKSVMLAHYESTVAKSFDRIEPLADTLQTSGRGPQRGRDLLRHIGEALSIQAKMVGRAEVAEKPELLWECPQYERLYQRLEDEYEVRDRHLALERKLELISRTAETLLNLLQHKRSLRVEWYIVVLIVIEICITVLSKL